MLAFSFYNFGVTRVVLYEPNDSVFPLGVGGNRGLYRPYREFNIPKISITCHISVI